MRRPVPQPCESVLRHLTIKNARRAIYFDYEGIPTKEPIFLGWRVDDQYSAAIIDRAFATCARRYGAQGAVSMSHKAAARHVLKRAIKEKRHLVCWSWHDLKIIWHNFRKREQVAFRKRFVNAIRIARPWHRRTFGFVPPAGARMSYFAAAFNKYIPPRYGDGIVANHLRAVRQALARRGTYAAFRQEDRASWVAAIKHNKCDLEVTQYIVSRILRNEPPHPRFAPHDHL